MPSLSKRSIVYRKTPAFKELYAHVGRDTFDARKNPEGIISVAVANNILMGDILTKQIRYIVERNETTELDLDYTDNHGSPAFRAVTANLLQKYIFKVDAPVDPNNIVVINGACAVVEQVVAAICDAGDCVMVPSPLYHSFEVDINGRNECEIVSVPLTDNMKLDFDVLDSIYESNTRQGKNIKLFMLCHPNNPTGTVFTKEEISRLIDWTKEKDMHLVSDEVYALSVYSTSPVEFVSAGNFMFTDRDVQHVHVIYGLSKDFMLNGLRVGMLYTQNRDLFETLRATSAFHSVSSHTQALLTNLLGNDEFVKLFLGLSQSRLTDCYKSVKGILLQNNIEFYDPQAGQFFWVNLAPLMRKKLKKEVITKEDEIAFWRKLVHEAKIFLHAGQFFRWEKPGWFRLCFTCQTISTIELLVQRLTDWVNDDIKQLRDHTREESS